MGNAAARILRHFKYSQSASQENLMLGTITSVSPIKLSLDDVEFEITSGILIDESIVDINIGDRILVAMINVSTIIIISKVKEI